MMTKYVGSVTLLIHAEADSKEEAMEKMLAFIHSESVLVDGAAELLNEDLEEES